jgi:hypothetical protein
MRAVSRVKCLVPLRLMIPSDLDLLNPVYYDPPATAHVRHRLEHLCRQVTVMARL